MTTRLQPLDDNLWVCRAAQVFIGLPVGSRMTVVRLRSGELVVHSPVRLDDQLKEEIDALGSVRTVVAPNCLHHLHAGQWLEAYPQADCWAPRGLRKKRPDLRIDHELGADRPKWGDEIEVIPIPSTPGWEETILWHGPSRSLIAPDLLQHFPTPMRGVWPWVYQKLAGIGRRPAVSRAIRLAFRDRPAARAIIDDLIARDPRRIIIAHGEIIDDDAPNLLREAYGWL